MPPDDRVTLSWVDQQGRLVEHDVDLDVAAALQRADGKPVIVGRGEQRRYRRWELAAAVELAKDRLALVDEELRDLTERLDRDWLTRHGIDPGAREH